MVFEKHRICKGDDDMGLQYRDIKDFNENDLKELFLSVNWSSGHYPEKLAVAIKNSGTVFTALDMIHALIYRKIRIYGGG